ncbi:MAG: hypothetical protein K6F14_05220 [Clostridiales bacterium]|nr:hypothetical protein [Clostridiales bacterium]
MTDLETMKYAKLYLEKLANGINPLTNEPVPESECINQVRISRCLFYVSKIIGRVIENDEKSECPPKTHKEPFSVTKEQLSKYVFEETPIPVSEIAHKINTLINLKKYSKLQSTSINLFLINKEFLVEKLSSNDRKYKIPTPQGLLLGITREERTGEQETYYVNVYDKFAQKYILDHIEEIAELNPLQKETVKNRRELQGKPWSADHEEIMVDLFKKGVPVSEIAITLKRSKTGIQARLKKLGLIEHRYDAK